MCRDSMIRAWLSIAMLSAAARVLPATDRTALVWDWREMEFSQASAMTRHIDGVAFSPDGSLVAGASKDTIGVWATATGKLVTRMKLPAENYSNRLAFTADGKSLISHSRYEHLLRVWDIKTGKQTREVPLHTDELKNNGDAFKAFSPDGSRIILDVYFANRRDHELQVFDITASKSIGKLGQASAVYDSWSKVDFAPDGKTLAFNGPANQLRIIDLATGKVAKELQPQNAKLRSMPNYSNVRYSPDGKYIIAQEHTGRVKTFDNYRYVIWGVEDGRRYWAMENRTGWISAGNRYLLTGTKSVYDLLADEEVAIDESPADERRLAGMSPDGKTLAFVGKASAKVDDGGQPMEYFSIYLTPAPVLPPVAGSDASELNQRELDFLWKGAVSENLFRRNHAWKALATRRVQAIELARQNVKPVPAADGQRIAKLLQQLDDDSPDQRDQASAELQAEAYRFEPLLRNALEAAKPGEVKNRLTSILNKAASETAPAALIAELRGIEFLESLKDAQGSALLKALAGGAAGARVTGEAAAAALARLERKE